MLTAASSVEVRSQVKDIRLQDVIRQIDTAHNPEQVLSDLCPHILMSLPASQAGMLTEPRAGVAPGYKRDY